MESIDLNVLKSIDLETGQSLESGETMEMRWIRDEERNGSEADSEEEERDEHVALFLEQMKLEKDKQFDSNPTLLRMKGSRSKRGPKSPKSCIVSKQMNNRKMNEYIRSSLASRI